MRQRAELMHLLRHDLRLAWRDVRSAFRIFGRRGFAALVVTLILVMHGAGWMAIRWLEDNADASGLPPLAGGVAFVLLLMIAQSLNGVTRALYGRGDLDLFVSSPLSARPLLLVRALAIACGAFVSAAIFVVPIADVAALTGHPRWLAFFPALVAGALLATTLGLVLAVTLFALIGPKRARLAAQILATFIGGAFMMAIQFNRLVPKAVTDAPAGWLSQLQDWAHVFDLPVRAAAGEPGALLSWLVLAALIFAVATLALGPRFIAQAMAAAHAEGAVEARTRPHRVGRDRAFRAGAGAALRGKEWRIVLRDPWIVSQILLQLLYISPLFVVLWTGGVGAGSPVVALAPTTVVVCFQLAASLTWLGLSGEDAPELLLTAPVRRRSARLAKIQAVTAMTAVVIVPLLLWLLWMSPRVAFGTALLAGFAGLAAIALNTWHAQPAARGSFAARHRESKLLALIEMAMSMLLGITAALGAAGSLWMLAPLAVIGLVLLANKPRSPATAKLKSLASVATPLSG